MSLFRKFLRKLLTTASLLGFLIGYIFISPTIESEKTITTADGQTLTIDMEPIPSLDDLATPNTDTSDMQILAFSQRQSTFMPQMWTGGS